MKTKKCSKCGVEKTLDLFGKRKASQDGLKVWCKDCEHAYRREWLDRNSPRRKEYNARSNARMKRLYAEDPEHRERKKRAAGAWREKVGPEVVRQANRRQLLKREYGMTPEEYDALMAKQDCCCGICGKRSKKLDVDHDHDTGAVRGLLCRACNVALGNLGDTAEGLQRALDYLSGPQPRLYEPLTFIA